MFAVASQSRHCFLVSLKKKEILLGFFEGLILLSWKRTGTGSLESGLTTRTSCFQIENETAFFLKLFFFFLKQLHVSINEWHGSWRGPKEMREWDRGHERQMLWLYPRQAVVTPSMCCGWQKDAEVSWVESVVPDCPSLSPSLQESCMGEKSLWNLE